MNIDKLSTASPSGTQPAGLFTTSIARQSGCQSDIRPSDKIGLSERYLTYRRWCIGIGVPFANVADWERINRQIPEDLFAFRPIQHGAAKKMILVSDSNFV